MVSFDNHFSSRGSWMLENVTLFPHVLLQIWPLGMKCEVLTETTWVRVPVQGMLQGAAVSSAFRTSFGASVPPQCLLSVYSVLLRLSGPVTRSFHGYLQPWKASSVKWTPKLLLLLQCFIHSATPYHSCMCYYATKMPGVQALRLCWKNQFNRSVSIGSSRAIALSAIPKSNSSVLLHCRLSYPQWGFSCSHAKKLPNTDVSFTLSELGWLKGWDTQTPLNSCRSLGFLKHRQKVSVLPNLLQLKVYLDRQISRQFPRQVQMFYIPSVLLVRYIPICIALNFSLHEVALQVNRILLLGSLLELKHVFFPVCTSLSPSAALLCNTVFRHLAVPPTQPMHPQTDRWVV